MSIVEEESVTLKNAIDGPPRVPAGMKQVVALFHKFLINPDVS